MPKVRSNEVLVGIAPVTLRILNTIMPVTRVFTAIDVAKLVIYTVSVQWQLPATSMVLFSQKDAVSQVARGDKLKLAYQIKKE